LLDVATAAVSIHRDFSDRVNRKRARLKYVIQDRGIEWFGAEMAGAWATRWRRRAN